MRRAVPWLAVVGIGLGLAGGWFGYRAWLGRAAAAEIERARRDIEGGRFALARKRLETLTRDDPGQAEAWLLRGECERALGRYEAARRSWEAVPPRSPFGCRAAVYLADDLVNAGSYRRAEEVLAAVQPDSDPVRYAINVASVRVFRFQGRHRDVRQRLRVNLRLTPSPVEDIKELWFLDNSPMPVEALGAALARADEQDDRVWLGRAHHAILTGRIEEARGWLDRSRTQTPDDPAVWLATLDLARAAHDPVLVREALGHLPADALDPVEVLELRAWWLAQAGDASAEEGALRKLVAVVAGRTEAWERLAALAAARGDRTEAARCHDRKAEADKQKEEYGRILLNGKPSREANRLAELAGKLGLPFQERAWALLAKVGADGWLAAAPALPLPEGPGDYGLTPPSRNVALAWLDDLPAFESVRPPTALAASSAAPVAPRFEEAAEAMGLRFRYDNGATMRRVLPETMSGGLALLDFDRDGHLDLFVVQGGPLQDDPARPREPDRLFRNRGDGTFEDATASSGLDRLPRGYGLGVAVGDVDGDGWPDLFLSRLESYALFRNRGDGTFEDATAAWGLAGRRDYPSSAAFADVDADGDLDLYVCHYMFYDPARPILCQNEKGEYLYCDPSRVEPAPDHLWRNDGGRFTDVSQDAGIHDQVGRGLGVVALDLDEDGDIDIYVANDGTANCLYLNRGDGTFEEAGHTAGLAGNAEGGFQASMGTTCGDVDGDGRPDLLVANFYGEASTLYLNLGGGQFTDATAPSGIGRATRYLLGFGTRFLDYDDDGDLDLATTNGHVNDDRPFYPYAMPGQLLAGLGDGRFVDVSAGVEPWSTLRVGRGLAVGDLDGDGRLDLAILPQDGPLAVFRNRTEGGRSLRLDLEGTRSHRDAVGAFVTIEAGGRRSVAVRYGGGSYQSSCEPTIHVGIGGAEKADLVEVRWPSGHVDRYRDLAAGHHHLREGDAEAEAVQPVGTPDRVARTPADR